MSPVRSLWRTLRPWQQLPLPSGPPYGTFLHGGGRPFRIVFGESNLTNRAATVGLNLQLSLGHAPHICIGLLTICEHATPTGADPISVTNFLRFAKDSALTNEYDWFAISIRWKQVGFMEMFFLPDVRHWYTERDRNKCGDALKVRGLVVAVCLIVF
jgi:hypothetical protein